MYMVVYTNRDLDLGIKPWKGDDVSFPRVHRRIDRSSDEIPAKSLLSLLIVRRKEQPTADQRKLRRES